LNRAEPRLPSDLPRNRLIDRRTTGAVTGEGRATDHAADGFVMSVARPRDGRRLVVEPAQHMNVVAERREGAETRREMKVRAGLRRDPIPLRNTVPVEPEHESAFDGRTGALRGGISRSGRIEHAYQRWKSHLDGATRQGHPLQETPTRHSRPLSDYL